MLFLTVLMNLSVSAFARGHRGVIFRCLMAMFDMYVLNSELLNGGPLSVFTCSGRPNSEKIQSRRGIIARADVLSRMSTKTYREYSSVTTRSCFPFGR